MKVKVKEDINESPEGAVEHNVVAVSLQGHHVALDCPLTAGHAL